MLSIAHLSMFDDAYKKMQALGQRVQGRSYSGSEITKIIRRQFPASEFVFKTYRDYSVDPDTVIVSGLYDCFDDANFLPSITVTLCYHPEQQIYFVDLIDWDQLSFDVAECIGHELVHRDQHLNGRTPKLKIYSGDNDEQNYLGGDDEIEAYAFSIAAEMQTFSKPIHECAMYGVYQTTFAHDVNIITQLEHQVCKYQEQLEQI